MKTSYLLFCALTLAVGSTACGQAAPADVFARQPVSLNGKWHCIVDPFDNGYFDYRHEPYDESAKPGGGYFLDRQPKDKTELIEYNFDASPTLNVPGDWNSQDDKLLYYEGSVWYRTRFDAKKPAPGNRLFVYFGAVNYEADVYLNGKKLGKHVGGFTPFAYEITDPGEGEGQFPGRPRQQPTARRGRADGEYGLVELRRHHARCAAWCKRPGRSSPISSCDSSPARGTGSKPACSSTARRSSSG